MNTEQSKITLLAKGAEILNYAYKVYNERYGTSFRTDFAEGESVDQSYGSVLMALLFGEYPDYIKC